MSRRSWISGSEPYQFGFPQKKHFASLVSLQLGEWPSTAFVSANCCCPIGLWRLAQKLSFLSFQGLFCRCRVQSIEHSKVAIVQHSYRESREWQVPNSQVWDHWQRYVIVTTYNSLLQSFQQSLSLAFVPDHFLSTVMKMIRLTCVEVVAKTWDPNYLIFLSFPWSSIPFTISVSL